MKTRSWLQHSYGHLLDGSRVMLAVIRRDDRAGEIPAVLLCNQDGLYRLWRNGRRQLLVPGFVWPTEKKGVLVRAEDSLRSHMPKHWGTQRGSICVLEKIPGWVLRAQHAKTSNIARVLIAWYCVGEKVSAAPGNRAETEIRPNSLLPQAPMWHPVAITVIPNTDVVVRALHSGVLLQRLKLGLERIYISEMAWIRAPKLEASLKALAHRFPQRLVLVKASTFGWLAQILRVSRVRAAEFQFIGGQLQGRYEDDFGYDQLWNTAPLQGIFLFCVGDIPRGVKMLFTYQLPVDFDKWDGLDINGMISIKKADEDWCAAQSERSVKALDSIVFKKPDKDSDKD